MLGANDANGGYNISQNDYKANLQTLITSLKNEGIKKIIVSNTPYNDGHSSLSLLSDYRNVVDELIDNKSILRGDILAYDWFYINWSGVHSDNVHLNQTGYAKLGEFRAAAIKSAIEYQINPDHYFTGGSTHTLETS
ncbi:MAG: SGNH/GDSL hydrolase family protein [Candidatus Peribacteria bacterium]|jgi:lysophospholipase L1-like esterase|nr:SGNH/GDSL hydrolase family protein [Candidatus Peribacteria bacterium]